MLFSERTIELNLLSWLIMLVILGDNLISSSTNGTSGRTPKKILSKTSMIKCNVDGTCRCPADPLTSRYPDITDPTCQRYYLCHLGFGFLKKCPVREAFHPDKTECISRSQVPYQICPSPIPCKTNGFAIDPTDCTKYYTCFYRQAYHYECEDEHYYDGVQEKCMLNKTQTEKCRFKEVQIPTKTTSTTSTTTINPLFMSSNDVDEI